MTQKLYEVALRAAVTGLILFIAAALLSVSAKVVGQVVHPQIPAGEGRAAPFQLFDYINGAYTYRDPGSSTDSEVGMANGYCVRAVLKQDTQLVSDPVKDNVIAQFCVQKSSNQVETDTTSGNLTFPQPVLQISACREDGPLGHASANPVCGPYYDVDLIGRAVTGSPFYP